MALPRIDKRLPVRQNLYPLTVRRCPVLLLALAAAALSCRTARVEPGPRIVQPGAPGEPSRVITARDAAALPRAGYTAADVAFMQGMIGHHAQALDMTALLATRTASDQMRQLARRIEVSQADEIALMQEWLRRRGQQVPDEHAHHAHDAKLMPGMLTPEQMGRLAAASGREFDRLFLELMISHHAGALIMVRDLFDTPGAGQESEIFGFATDVDADQRMEIVRMGVMLKELQK
jgi:uncharacterized protein (DUF305 family)